jgi:hypothetical protein
LNAHAFLTVYYVFLTNTQIRSGGSVKAERDTDATNITYYTPKELREMREQYLAQAQNLIAAFATVDFSETVETVAGDHFISQNVPAVYRW